MTPDQLLTEATRIGLLAEGRYLLAAVEATVACARDGRISQEQALELLAALQRWAQELLPPLLAVTRPGEWPAR